MNNRSTISFLVLVGFIATARVVFSADTVCPMQAENMTVKAKIVQNTCPFAVENRWQITKKGCLLQLQSGLKSHLAADGSYDVQLKNEAEDAFDCKADLFADIDDGRMRLTCQNRQENCQVTSTILSVESLENNP